MKRIAAITMVRNDDFFLLKWVEYYGRELGRENLYIYFDGLDQQIPVFCAGTHAEAVEKIGTQVISAEKGRLKFLSEVAARLLSAGYDLVIGTDADEFLVADPRLGKSLAEYLSDTPVRGSLSGLGLDLGQKDGEADVTGERPFLQQRHYAVIGPRYTKPSVLSEPLTWGSGFHRVKGRNFHIGKDLYLLHFGYFDRALLQARFGDRDRLAQGWGEHMQRRAQATAIVNRRKPRPFDRGCAFARRLQRILRPPYAWNKPSMMGLKLVVEIPERFRNLL